MSRSRAFAALLNLAIFLAFAWAVEHYWGWSRLLAPWHAIPASTLALALLGMLVSYALRALRIFIAEAEIPRGAFLHCLRLIVINSALNLLLPARSGEASFPILLKRWFGIDVARGAGTLVWLRLLDLHVLATVGTACAAAGWLAPNQAGARVVQVLAALAASAPLILFALHAKLGVRLGGSGKFIVLLRRMLAGVPYRLGELGRDLLLTWAAWTAKLAALGWVLSRLSNLRPALGVIGAIGGDLSTVLPVHAPGGFGTYEAGVLALLAPAASPSGELLAAAVNLHLLLLTIALAGGAIAWLSGAAPRIPTAGKAMLDSAPSPSINSSSRFAVTPFPAAAPTLSIVIPMYREQDNVVQMLARVHEGLAAYPGAWELICVDDGSPDETGRRLLAEGEKYGPHVRVVRFARNHGQTMAMQTGIDLARGQVIATLDGDLQNDPADIPRMVRELDERDLDLLAGRRANRQDHWLSRKLPSKLANWLIGRVTGVTIHDYGCSLKVSRARVLKQVRLFGEMHRFIPVWAAMVTSPARIGETAVHHSARQFGESKYGISRTFRVILDLLTVFFFLHYRRRPGHFFGAIGLLLASIGSLAMAYLLVVKFAMHQDIGNRPMFLAAVLLLIFSMQFITTGILSEMIARIYYQRRRGPLRINDDLLEAPKAGWHAPAIVLSKDLPPTANPTPAADAVAAHG